jgi:hypothetical protein
MECDELTEPEDQPEYDDDQSEDAEDDEELLRFGRYQRNIVIHSKRLATESMQV